MSKSSIHFREALSTSEAHNLREVPLDYNRKDLEKNNESFILTKVDDRLKEVKNHCKEVSGRKLQKNAQIIREAVVNLTAETTMDDLKKLSNQLNEEFGINCFQIHIHKDEGHVLPNGEFKINHHAHMLFDWQDKKLGTILKINRAQLSQMQTVVADVLKMERGVLKVNSNRERLEPIEYKKQEEEKKYKLLQGEVSVLEQKKNSDEFAAAYFRERIKLAQELVEINSGNVTENTNKALRELLWASDGEITEEDLDAFTEEDLKHAIDGIESEIKSLEN
jgi:hypothetical protein